MNYDVGSAAVALYKNSTDSEQCKELLSRIFLAISTTEKHRGKLVQQGGGKVRRHRIFSVRSQAISINRVSAKQSNFVGTFICLNLRKLGIGYL